MYFQWEPYVPVAKRLANARRAAAKLAKKEGRELAPVQASGRKLTKSFWGQAWCDNLDRYSDLANRLPRGRRYLGNGSVIDLQIKSGLIESIVAGSDVYHVTINIKTLAKKSWSSLQRECAQCIHSLLDLLQGRFDEGVMQRLVRPGGLFPEPKEISMRCSCPDYAAVCKHIAAVMYGVGVRLDVAPELLFVLRNVDHTELITQAVAADNLAQTLTGESSALAGSDLSELFGIEIDLSGGGSEGDAAETAAGPAKTATRKRHTEAKSTAVQRRSKKSPARPATKSRQPKSRQPARKKQSK